MPVLESYGLVNVPSGSARGGAKSGKPVLHVTVHSCILGKFAIVHTGWEQGDEIGFHRYPEYPDNWYVSLTEGGFPLRSNNARLEFCNKAMSQKLLGTAKSASFILGEGEEMEGVMYYPMLRV